MRTIYRDGIEEQLDGDIKVTHTREGHIVEAYMSEGKPRFFVTLGTGANALCAHGATVADAVADALWKDEANRPDREELVKEIQEAGKDRKVTLQEFRHLTGACAEGCRVAIQRAKIDMSKENSMTAYDIRDRISREWGEKLLSILGWE